ncbi:MAG: metal ABC transporter permease [Sphaerochaetaceae bacterium]
MVDLILSAFSVGVIRNAFFAMVIGGLTLSLLGIIIVSLSLTAIRFTLMHVGLLGAAAGLALGFSSTLGAYAAVLCASFAMGFMVNRQSITASSISGLFMTGSLAGAFILLAVTGVPAMQVFDIFAGNILMMSKGDLIFTFLVGLAVVLTFFVAYREIQLVLLNRELAHLLGVPVEKIIGLMFVLLGLGIATALRLVGALLVDAIILLPAMAALRVAKNFGTALLLSCLFGLVVAVGGFFGALLLNLPLGSTAALVSALILAVVMIINRLK